MIYNNFDLIKIDAARIDETCSAYFKWKDLNTYIQNQSHRGINMPDAIYQWRRKYVRKNKSGVVPTLTANQGEGGHNVCIIRTDDGRIRKMTPRECFNTRGFPTTFKLPNTLSDAKLYKQAGNSVCVPVIRRIGEQIVKALEG